MSSSVPLPPDAVSRLRMLEKTVAKPQDTDRKQADQTSDTSKK